MTIDEYMSSCRNSDNIDELKRNFDSVIAWASKIFEYKEKMKGLKWGELYEKYHTTSYNSTDVNNRVDELFQDEHITDKKGIFEYVLGGEENTKLLNVRIFKDSIKNEVYKRQTEEAKENNTSNCPLCSIGNDSNATKIWNLNDMDADHVEAWSRGGSSDIENCQVLCKTHNRAKGNR